MPLLTITREQFQSAVEAGIRAGLDRGVLTFGHAARLRAYAAEHVGPVAVGAFDWLLEDGSLCHCPLADTGLYHPGLGGPLKRETSWGVFTTPFDRAIDAIHPDNDEAVEVVA